jgi:prephenate dehydrogenase
MKQEKVFAELGTGIRRIAILGTGLIGASIGLALREQGYSGAILGWDTDAAALAHARVMGAVDAPVAGAPDDDAFVCAAAADVIVLAGPVLSIAQWLEQLAPVLGKGQLVTDVGSVKGFLVERCRGIPWRARNRAVPRTQKHACLQARHGCSPEQIALIRPNFPNIRTKASGWSG